MKASVIALTAASVLANAQSVTQAPPAIIDPNGPYASQLNAAQAQYASVISSVNQAVQSSITALTETGSALNNAQISIQSAGQAQISAAGASVGSVLASITSAASSAIPQPSGSNSGSSGNTASQTQSGSTTVVTSISVSQSVGVTTASDGQVSSFTSPVTVSHTSTSTTSPNAAAMQTAGVGAALAAGAAILAAAF